MLGLLVVANIACAWVLAFMALRAVDENSALRRVNAQIHKDLSEQNAALRAEVDKQSTEAMLYRREAKRAWALLDAGRSNALNALTEKEEGSDDVPSR